MKDLDADALRGLLRVMVRKLGFLHRGEAGCYGLTLGQCHTIIEIGQAAKIPVSRLAENLNLDGSTVTRNVDTLERAGLVVREPSTSDRRITLLRLTEEGNARYKKINEGMNRYYSQVIASIPAGKRAVVAEGLELFAAALNPSLLDEEATTCCEAEVAAKRKIKKGGV